MTEAVTKQLTITRVLNASIERVFDAWTKPELISQWWGPQGVTIPESEADLKVGGKLYIVMLAGEQMGPMAGARWPMKGMFEQIDRPSKLVFTNQAIDEAGNVLIDGRTTVELESIGPNETRLSLNVTAVGVAPGSSQMLAGMNQGWTQSIDKLEKFARASR